MIAAAFVVATVGFAAVGLGGSITSDRLIPRFPRYLAGGALIIVGTLLVATAAAVLGWPTW